MFLVEPIIADGVGCLPGCLLLMGFGGYTHVKVPQPTHGPSLGVKIAFDLFKVLDSMEIDIL